MSLIKADRSCRLAKKGLIREVRRKNIVIHKGLRHMPFRTASLVQGLAVVAIADGLLLWQMPRLLQWHSWAVEILLRLANVPWSPGRQLTLLPRISVVLLHTAYLDYRSHPLYPAGTFAAALAFFLVASRRSPAPLKPFLFLAPMGLGITFLYLEFVSPIPYTPEDFCALWYRGESYLWLLLPLIFVLSFFILNVPLRLKTGWLSVLLLYSFLWSAIRLAFALATFYYFGSIWLPFFYFAVGVLADFLYIVAAYSLAMDGAAAFLARQQEAWR